VAARILQDLNLSRQGWDVFKAVGGPRGANSQAVIRLMHTAVNDSIGITSAARKTITADQAEAAMERLDEIGDGVRDRIKTVLEA